jgi:LytS/YehU family sensor histidine kinase
VAQTCGIPKLQLMVLVENAAVLAFYQPLGHVDDQVTVLRQRLYGTVP